MSRRARGDRVVVRIDEGYASSSLSDEALVAAMAEGDDQAGLVFVRRYQRRIYGLAFTVVGDHGTAEDVAQEAFVRVWRHAAVFDPRRASVATWVSRITRNLAIDAIRLRRAVPVDPDDLTFASMLTDAPLTEDAAVQSDEFTRVARALSALPNEQRRALLRAGYFGQSASEISEAESIPIGTAKSRIRLGLSKIRSALAAEVV